MSSQPLKTSCGDFGASAPTQSFAKAVLSAVDAGLGSAIDVLFTWQQRRADRMRLQRLDDHMLRDIGLSKADIDEESRKPFWRP